MRNAILPHILAVFAVGSALAYCYDLRRLYDTKKYDVQEEWATSITRNRVCTM